MTKLISKIQYKTFEAGEFTEVLERSYDETISLIESFPWKEQRDKILIDLTNPSVTIEGKNSDFLKLAIFYNGKYVLHYLNDKQVLFTKSFYAVEDGYSYIKKYFEGDVFNISDFKKENTWLKHNLQHFQTQDFRYYVTRRSAIRYLISTSGFNFLCTFIWLGIYFFSRVNTASAIGVIITLIMIFFIGGGLHLLIFFNYYHSVKNTILVMSKGNDTFYFGDIGDPVQFGKKDITKVSTIRSKGTRNQFNGFAIVEIELKNQITLTIPNLLIEYSALENKLSEYPSTNINQFPWLKF